MIFTEDLIRELNLNKIDFFTGVPDSILKNFLYKLDTLNKKKHIVAANEGSAISIGLGYHLSTKKIPCVYFQNSGLGNSINPLISIAHKKVYSIPLFLLIGWRGAPGIKDEPQHNTKGKITPKLLQNLNIKFVVLNDKSDLKKISALIKLSKKNNSIVACLVKKKTLINRETTKKRIKKVNSDVLRSNFIEVLLNKISSNSKIISTTGYTSREIMFLRKKLKIKKGKYFYMIGGMGHSLSVSLGASLNSKNQVICLDGDGSMIMHLGSLITASFYGGQNLKYILLNNNIHESVGGTTTNVEKINLKLISAGFGFRNYFMINNIKNMKKVLNKFLKSKGPSFLEVKIKNGSLKKLPRPTDLKKIKNDFLKN
ncbi:phosphonopyruvate decarboxylase [Candidatus Pelagibacter sp.]|nr:phosphonopyruvate decarboxylase [Candidatus Pelagibacter sp.]